jgi:hypothetical protein
MGARVVWGFTTVPGRSEEAVMAAHYPDPDPEHGAFDVCKGCGKAIVEHWSTGQWVPMTGTADPECYGRKR